MDSFSAAAQQSQTQVQPVVRGMTARAEAARADEFKNLLAAALGGSWKTSVSPTGWIDAETDTPPDLGRAWDVARSLQDQGFDIAEPLLLVVTPSEKSPDAAARLEVWGQGYSWADTQRIASASLNSNWSIVKMKVDKAWQKFASLAEAGAGVVIAHPDTGYSKHPQIIKRILANQGLNFVEFDGDAQDRFSEGILTNPGHGTATSSVILSPSGDGGEKADVMGVAPGAKLIPMRVSTSVVHFDFLNVSRAIENAVGQAHVISMSLGGPKSSPRLRDAVKHALDEGIIIVSAAGNMVPAVMFPAAIPGVVAMAASNPIDGPWRWSGFGDEVTATAPGEMVWNARASLEKKEGEEPKVKFGVDRGHGTSFSTAAVAGIAALWLSHHGRDKILADLGNDKSLIPFAFHMLLSQTADSSHEFVRAGKGGFGAGIVDAEKLLDAKIPKRSAVEEYRAGVLGEKSRGLFNISFSELFNFFRMPNRPGRAFAATESGAVPTVDTKTLRELLDALLGNAETSPYLDELLTLFQTVPNLRQRLFWEARRLSDPKRKPRAVALLRGDLLTSPIKESLSEGLRSLLAAPPAGPPSVARSLQTAPETEPALPDNLPEPQTRRLRAYAFDPSLDLRLSTRTINQVTIQIPWEKLTKGPVGEYIEVIDVDPATDCAYDPADLDHPYLLAQDGYAPSEGNPKFHQQMVYAVAMKTIKSFEKALGRPAFWAPLQPWRYAYDKAVAEPRWKANGKPDYSDQYVQRLRIYPHALRERNAYYSPQKRALLFGYFAADDGNPGEVYPGGIVFTCLSHDVVSHETTHALLDGMHAAFNKPTNPDVFAFHEAFSDIVALFQHFSYPEVLTSQIAHARGDLSGENLLVQLAQQFGKATGKGHALRDAIGGVRKMKKTTTAPDPISNREREVVSYEWSRYVPDATLLEDMDYAGEAHARGSILVAAVFDAFLAIYESRVADLVRIATGGTGKLPDGNLQPDLVNRMSMEARKSAEHVLGMCIRALDYTPPFDITFGEYLRAIITADRDLYPDDPHGYRTSFIEAFRAWGIYPRDVRVLSEESLVWHSPGGIKLISPTYGIFRDGDEPLNMLRRALLQWKPGGPREAMFEGCTYAQRLMHRHIEILLHKDPATEEDPDFEPIRPLCRLVREALLTDKERTPPDPPNASEEPDKEKLRLSVTNLRASRRVGPLGEFITELVFEVTREEQDPGNGLPFAGGITFIVSMEDWIIRYAIFKRFGSEARRARQAAYTSAARNFGAAEYKCGGTKAQMAADRTVNLERMRISSCECDGRVPVPGHIDEPFAMLHREPYMPADEPKPEDPKTDKTKEAKK